MRFAAKALGGIFTVKSPLGEMLGVVASQFAESAGVGRVGTALGARGEKREILRLRSCVRPRFREGMHCFVDRTARTGKADFIRPPALGELVCLTPL
jgi:hypothetical protein